MKKNNLILILTCVFFYLASSNVCYAKQERNYSENKFVNKNYDKYDSISNCKFPEEIYNYLTSIYLGDVWEDDKTTKSYYYRILVCTIEETASVYVELFEVMDGDITILVDRNKLSPKIFDDEKFRLTPELLEWLSPTKIRLKANDNVKLIDINSHSFKL
ncbi:MAG: hypothetical protein H6Q15_2008 [Bacteroidetes bacterium]|nr:hypothetical protein [Bacteroidota bacterium]